MKVATNIYFDQRTTKKDGTHPVKLRVSFEGKKKLYNVTIDKRVLSLLKDDAGKIFTSKPPKDYKSLKFKIDTFESSAIDVIEKMDHFSFELFEAEFLGTVNKTPTVQSGFDQKIEELKNNNQHGTANAYQTALNSFKLYKNYKEKDLFNVRYDEITLIWLNKYKKWSTNNTTTQGMYLRALRVILNGVGKPFVKHYPFENFEFPISEKRKDEALTIEQRDKIVSIVDSNKLEANEQEALDFWMFSYNCGGANYADIFLFTWIEINFEKNEIKFIREKTKKTYKKQKYITINLSPRMIKHIKKYGNKRNKYVFNFFNAKMPASKMESIRKNKTGHFNELTKRIAIRNGIKINLTSTVARHTKATIMDNEGEKLSTISAMLGHSNRTITEDYLKGLSDEEHREAQSRSQV